MSFRSLATLVHKPETDGPVLSVAAALCRAWEAHLDVLALGTDRLQVGAFQGGATAIAIQATFQEALDEAKTAEDFVNARLDGELFGWRVAAAVAQIGAIGQIVGRHAGLADLIVLPTPYGEGRSAEDVAVVEAALFSTRTPVLILPPDTLVPARPSRIVVGWNQSGEALTAIRAALPLLKTAEVVDIAIVDPSEHAPDRSDPGGELAQVLARHGVRAEISVLARTLPRVSDVVLRHIAETGADMLVMGAYGHSRLREAILGGATRHMLQDATVPTLMAH